MKKNESDIFEGIPKESFNSENFFLNEDFSNMQIFKQNITEPTRRLNNYDSDLLEEDAYKDINNDLFKLEYKMAKTEENLKVVESQILAAQEINDYKLNQELIKNKKALEDDYNALLELYNDKCLSAKISGRILNMFGEKSRLKTLQNKTSFISQKIISKMPKQLLALFELKKSLNKLETINNSVDKLMSLNIPYGENINKYEQLSKYIIKANSIQAEISKQIKNK